MGRSSLTNSDARQPAAEIGLPGIRVSCLEAHTRGVQSLPFRARLLLRNLRRRANHFEAEVEVCLF